MSKFAQATEYKVHMYAKFEYLNVHIFLQINTSRYEF
jgi:hypothetical protein